MDTIAGRKAHDLKCWPGFFAAVANGSKPFEIRRGEDRQYQVGEILRLREWNPATQEYTGSQCVRYITYVLHGGDFLPDDTWVLGLSNEIPWPS